MDWLQLNNLPRKVQSTKNIMCTSCLGSLGSSKIQKEKQNDGTEKLMAELSRLKCCAKEGRIPFSEEEIDKAVSLWRDEGFGPVHHSETFRKLHHPAYRVVRKELLEKLI